MEDKRKTGGPACSGNYDRQAASRMPTDPERHHTLQIIRAGEAAALAVLERDEAHKVYELNQLRELASHALRQRAIKRIMARQRRKRDVEREKAERLAALEEQLQQTDHREASFRTRTLHLTITPSLVLTRARARARARTLTRQASSTRWRERWSRARPSLTWP